MDKVTIALTVAEWQNILGALEHAPHIIVNAVSPAIAELHRQAFPQFEEIQRANAEKAASEDLQD